MINFIFNESYKINTSKTKVLRKLFMTLVKGTTIKPLVFYAIATRQ